MCLSKNARENDILGSTLHCILTVDLGKRNICARFVSPFLAGDQKVAKPLHCLNMKSAVNDDPNFLKDVTADTTWCFQYKPGTKRHSSEWVDPVESTTKILHYQNGIKLILTVFFNSKGIIHQKFRPQWQTITEVYNLFNFFKCTTFQ